jgi:hypothetical protein
MAATFRQRPEIFTATVLAEPVTDPETGEELAPAGHVAVTSSLRPEDQEFYPEAEFRERFYPDGQDGEDFLAVL